ncbi:MAG: tripartite tricarboxylate transporter substrate binding protein [Betaproteobacteria bacterium]|nr:tripartite tricarboxylate transporter substrate binding protein [Betaproteobacteria bacterium]
MKRPGILAAALAVAVTGLAPGSFRAHAAASLDKSAGASRQAFPTKPIRFVIPFPAGGFSDITGRVVAQRLAESVSQPVVSDNRPGASGNIGADLVAKAAPDGYTLLINSINYVINPSVVKAPFDPVRDFTAVSLIASGPPLVMTVSAATPWKSVKDVINAAKAQPGKLNFANSGLGSSPHLSIELLKSMAGINVVQVPYKGAALAIGSLIGGDIAVVFPNLPVVLPHLKSGRVRGLAVTSARRSPALPDLPTMAEAGLPGFDVSGFLGLLAPAKTPRSIIGQLNTEIVRMAREPDFIERFAAFGMQPVGSTPAEMDRFTREQIAKWAKVLKEAGVSPQ